MWRHPSKANKPDFAIRPLSVCLSVTLSVTLVYCGQTVGWIKMKLDTQIGLGLATLC